MDAEQIKSVVVDQKEEAERVFSRERIIEREFIGNWRSAAETGQIKVVTGVRRSGKSTFALQLLSGKTYGYINFDDERLVGLKTADLNTVLQAFYQLFGDIKFVFLDEVQNVDGWELFASRLKRTGFNVFVTGSNARLLSKELATHLTGRHIPIEIFPFSFREFLTFDDFKIDKKALYSTKQRAFLLKKLQEYLEVGGFPEALKDREDARTYLSTLYSMILTRDVVGRQKIKYIKTIREISNYLVSNFARPITFNKIKDIFNLKSAHTSKNYVSYLEEAYLIFLVDKFSFKHKEVLASPKKVYVADTGIINAMAFKSGRNAGRLMENLVFIELMRKKSTDTFLEIYYWKDYAGKEVDFIIKRGLEIEQLIQVCYNVEDPDTKEREVKALVKASKELKCKNLLVITWDYEGKEEIKKRKIKFIPLWKWLLS